MSHRSPNTVNQAGIIALSIFATMLPSFSCAGELPTIDAIMVRLLYERTGSVSPNIAPPSNFGYWNTPIGEGDAAEPANDLLVQIELSIADDQANVATPLRVTVSSKEGKVLSQRTFESLFFSGGKVVKSLFVPDASCADIAAKAAIGDNGNTTRVNLECGEWFG